MAALQDLRVIDTLARVIEDDTGFRPVPDTSAATLIYILETEFDEDRVNYSKLERQFQQYVPEGWVVRMTWDYEMATPPDAGGMVLTPLTILVDSVRLTHTGTETYVDGRSVCVFRRVSDLPPEAADRYLAGATRRGFGPLTPDKV